MSDKKRAALRELWRRGSLDFILHDKQKEIKHDLLSARDSINVVLCARRFGKTVVLLNMAVEKCIKKPGAIIKYICPQLKQGKQNIRENMYVVLKGCPKDMEPEWKENEKKYIFPNGSEIQVAGTDNGSHESLRGGRADMCIVDEAGFCNHLDYVIKSILRPTTLTTKGRIYLVSTPSKSSTHEFIQKYVNPRLNQGKIKKYTIHDNPMLTDQDIQELLSDYLEGENDPAFKREYLCEIVEDSDALVFGNFAKYKDELVKVVKKPAFFDPYVSGDVGFKDLTVYLFGYWDYLNATLVIEDELVMNGDDPDFSTQKLAEEIKRKESEIFVDTNKNDVPVYMRVMDNNLIMVRDLQMLHGLNFLPTDKDNKEAQVNQVKMMIANKQIIINPRCKTLIYHLGFAKWKTNRREFDHINDYVGETYEDNVRGAHADAADALIYLVRNLVRSHNPYPQGWGKLSGDNIQQSRLAQAGGELAKTFKSILNIKK